MRETPKSRSSKTASRDANPPCICLPGAHDAVVVELDTTIRERILALDAKRAKLLIEGDLHRESVLFTIIVLKNVQIEL